MTLSWPASDFSWLKISFRTAGVGARRAADSGALAPTGALARAAALAARERGAVTRAAPPMATRVTKRRRIILRGDSGMAFLLGSWKASVERRDAVDQRAVRAGVLQKRDRVSFDAHLPGQDRGGGEGLSGEYLAPERERCAQREARVGVRWTGYELGARTPAAIEPHEEVEAPRERPAGVESEEDVAV